MKKNSIFRKWGANITYLVYTAYIVFIIFHEILTILKEINVHLFSKAVSILLIYNGNNQFRTRVDVQWHVYFFFKSLFRPVKVL